MKQIDRDILALSVPAVVATVTTPLLGLMDTAFTGHMGGAVYLAGIALGSNLFNLLYWLFGFLRMGTSGITAQAVGAADTREQWLTLYRSLALALTAGLAIVALQTPIASLYVWATGPEAAPRHEMLRYFSILVWGAPAMLATTAMSGWFVGMHRPKSAMWMSIAIDVMNILVTALLVLGAGLKVPGVAAGTLTAQWTGFFVALRLAWKAGGKPLRPTLGELIDRAALRRFMSINRDIFLRTLCMIAVTLWFTREGAREGDTVLAANALLMQLFLLFSYIMDSLAYAGEALAGARAGARDHAGLMITVRALFRWGAFTALAFTIVYFLAGEWILRLLSDDAGVVATAREYLAWAVGVPLAGFAAFTWDGIMIGLTATRAMLASMAASTAVYFATYLSLRHTMGNHALWLAFLAFLLCRSASLTVFFRTGFGKRAHSE